jgi:hypothetical protein
MLTHKHKRTLHRPADDTAETAEGCGMSTTRLQQLTVLQKNSAMP